MKNKLRISENNGPEIKQTRKYLRKTKIERKEGKVSEVERSETL